MKADGSLFLGILGMFPGGYTPQNFAGLAGLGVLLGLVVLTLLPPARPIIHAGWWVMLALYVAACIVAVMLGH